MEKCTRWLHCVFVHFQHNLVWAAGWWLAVNQPACRSQNLAVWQRRGHQEGSGRGQPGQRGHGESVTEVWEEHGYERSVGAGQFRSKGGAEAELVMWPDLDWDNLTSQTLPILVFLVLMSIAVAKSIMFPGWPTLKSLIYQDSLIR